MGDFLSSLRDEALRRLQNPVVTAFVIAWCLWNHEFFVICFGAADVPAKLNLLDERFGFAPTWGWWSHFVALPVGSACVYLFLMPFVSRWALVWLAAQENRTLRELMKERNETPVTREQMEAAQARADKRTEQLRATIDGQRADVEESGRLVTAKEKERVRESELRVQAEAERDEATRTLSELQATLSQQASTLRELEGRLASAQTEQVQQLGLREKAEAERDEARKQLAAASATIAERSKSLRQAEELWESAERRLAGHVSGSAPAGDGRIEWKRESSVPATPPAGVAKKQAKEDAEGRVRRAVTSGMATFEMTKRHAPGSSSDVAAIRASAIAYLRGTPEATPTAGAVSYALVCAIKARLALQSAAHSAAQTTTLHNWQAKAEAEARKFPLSENAKMMLRRRMDEEVQAQRW